MLKCLKFELFKLFSNKIYPIAIVVCMIIAVPLLNNEARIQSESNETNISVTQDEYDSFLKKIQNAASEQGKVSIFQDNKQSFSSRNIEKTAADMKKMQGTVIKNDTDTGVNIIADFTYIKFVTMFIIILAVYIVFFKEKEEGIYPLIKTTPNGNANTYTAKTLVLLINSFFVILIFFLVSTVVLSKYGGYGDLERSIQSVKYFMSCDIKCNVSEMLIIVFLLRFAGAFVFSLCVSAIALKTNNSIIFAFAALSFTTLNYLFTLIPYQSVFVFFKYINFINIYDPCEIIAAYKNINIFSYPINAKTIVLLSMFIAAILIFVAGLIMFKKRELLAKKNNLKKHLKHFNITENFKSVFLFELYKSSFMNKAFFIILVFVAIEAAAIFNTQYYKSPQDFYYANYIEILQGELTDEKAQYIENENKRIEETEQAVYRLNEKYNNGEISLTQLQNGLKKKQFSENRKIAFQRILNQYEYIISNPKAQFIYDTGYNKLFNIGTDNRSFGLLGFALLFVSVVLCSVETFTIERKKGMIAILNSTPNGTRKTIINKVAVSFLYTTALFLITCFSQLLIIKFNYGVNGLFAPLCSLKKFANAQNISIISAIIIKYFIVYILYVVITAFSLLVSNMISKKNFWR